MAANAAAALLGFIFWIIVARFYSPEDVGLASAAIAALGLLAAWTAISVHHVVDKLYVNNMFIYFGVMLGLQQVLDKQND